MRVCTSMRWRHLRLCPTHLQAERQPRPDGDRHCRQVLRPHPSLGQARVDRLLDRTGMGIPCNVRLHAAVLLMKAGLRRHTDRYGGRPVQTHRYATGGRLECKLR